MALIIEDGTIVANAQSYMNVADLRTFAGLRGVAVPSSDEACERLLIKAMDALEEFATKWKGQKVSATQPLAWPRSGAVIDDVNQPSNEIPRELEYAQLQLALEANQNDLQPNEEQRQVVKEKVGPIEMTYENKGRVMGVSAFAKPMALIRPLLKNHLNLVRL